MRPLLLLLCSLLVLRTTIMASDSIVLGGGCFWCVEAAYRAVPGVTAAVSGYAGGNLDHPTYEAVCSGHTGHAEVVLVTFDPARVSLDRLLDLFFHIHDPTTPNQQGPDHGTQYRSIILVRDAAQRQAAQAAMARAQTGLRNPIVTEVMDLATDGPRRFHAAEDYHQDFFTRHPDQGYCRMMIPPKLKKVQAFLGAPAAATQASLVTVVDLEQGRLTDPHPVPRLELDEAAWRSRLAPDVFRILRNHGTEPAFCGGLLKNTGEGFYCCAGCGLPLFRSADKFDSGTGWPSFTREVHPGNIRRIEDRSHGMVRIEIRCARCDGHLGHVFDDGPPPTHTRHCLNSLALTFVAR